MDDPKELLFPSFGLDITRSQYDETRNGTTQVANNVRTFEALTQRGRGGSRPGLSRFIETAVPGTGAIQNLDLIVTTSPLALSATALNDYYPVDVPGGTFTENFPASYPGDSHYTTPDGVYGGYGYIPDPTTPNTFQTRISTFGSGIQPLKPTLYTPLIEWSNPTPIQVGTVLSGTQLNGVFKDPNTGLIITGASTYIPPAGTVLPVGNDIEIRVLFEPDDDIYRFGREVVTIDVFDWFDVGGKKYPNVMTVTFAWGSRTFTTTATIQSPASSLVWFVDGLDYTLVDLNHGAANGTLRINRLIFGGQTGFTGADTGAASNQGYGITQPAGTSDITKNPLVTTQNPFSVSTTIASGIMLTDAVGGTETHDLTVTISGLAIT